MAIILIHDCDIERQPDPTAYEGDFRDCWIEDVAPDTFHDGTQFAIGLQDVGGKLLNIRRGLLWFDLNAFVPASATITAAVWWFYIMSTSMTSGMVVQLVRIRRNDEGSGNHWKEREATWNSYRTGQAWGIAGADHLSLDRDTGVQITGSSGWHTTGWHTQDMLTLVSDAWSNRAGICTFIAERYNDLSTEGEAYIHAKDYYDAGPALVHHLRITYTLDGRMYQVMVS